MIIPDSNKVNPRADSFSLYLNYVGDKILTGLLPKSKLDNKLQISYNHERIQNKGTP